MVSVYSFHLSHCSRKLDSKNIDFAADVVANKRNCWPHEKYELQVITGLFLKTSGFRKLTGFYDFGKSFSFEFSNPSGYNGYP
jgi:hypothetical protein